MGDASLALGPAVVSVLWKVTGSVVFLSQVMRKSHEAREKLLRLGIFRQVDVLIDTCQGTHRAAVSLPPASPSGVMEAVCVTDLKSAWGFKKVTGSLCQAEGGQVNLKTPCLSP